MSEPTKIDSRRVAAYSLLLSLHRYAKWLSALRSATPTTVPLANREIHLIMTLRDEHFHVIGRQIDEVVERHPLLAAAVNGRVLARDGQSSQKLEFVTRGANQGESVNRLVSMVEHYLKGPATRESTGVVAHLGAWSEGVDQRPSSRTDAFGPHGLR